MSEEKKIKYQEVTPFNFLEVVADGVIILEPRKLFNGGIIGYNQEQKKLVYSLNKLVESHIKEGWEAEEALDWLYYNTLRAADYFDNYPLFIEDW